MVRSGSVKVEFSAKNNSMEFLFDPITRRINVIYEARVKCTWHHSKLAVEEVGFFGRPRVVLSFNWYLYTLEQSALLSWVSCFYVQNCKQSTRITLSSHLRGCGSFLIVSYSKWTKLIIYLWWEICHPSIDLFFSDTYTDFYLYMHSLIIHSLYTVFHDDVIKWKHFQRYWPFVRGIHLSPVNSPHKGQWLGALMFLPEASFGLRALSLPASVCLCVCLSVCVSVNPVLVRAINHHAFKLEPSNLDKRCKRTWLRSLLFWGAIDLDFQDQISLEKPNLPHFELVHAITHHIFKLEPSNLDKRCKPTC